MNPSDVRNSYRRMIDADHQVVKVRRFISQGAAPRYFEVDVPARVTGYEPDELVGGIQQGDRRVIFMVEDLIARHFPVPVVASDNVIVQGTLLRIHSPTERRCREELIAYDVTARG